MSVTLLYCLDQKPFIQAARFFISTIVHCPHACPVRRFLQACFRSRNRQLRGILAHAVAASSTAAAAATAQYDSDPGIPSQQRQRYIAAATSAADAEGAAAAEAAVAGLELSNTRPNKLPVAGFQELFAALQSAGATLR